MRFSTQSISAMSPAAAERFRNQVAIVDGDTRLSFAELLEEVRYVTTDVDTTAGSFPEGSAVSAIR
jgi:non-ribosomal peptide synthetase component E (peptide arylation enzyme)